MKDNNNTYHDDKINGKNPTINGNNDGNQDRETMAIMKAITTWNTQIYLNNNCANMGK